MVTEEVGRSWRRSELATAVAKAPERQWRWRSTTDGEDDN
jgi:hypothetical protein